MRYHLDTNIVSTLEKRPDGPLLSRLLNAGFGNIGVSVVVAGELQFGAEKSRTVEQRDNLLNLVGEIEVVAMEAEVAATYGRIRADLERRGTPIGANDLWIAAHALTLNATLVTANIDEFSRVAGLRIENWLDG